MINDVFLFATGTCALTNPVADAPTVSIFLELGPSHVIEPRLVKELDLAGTTLHHYSDRVEALRAPQSLHALRNGTPHHSWSLFCHNDRRSTGLQSANLSTQSPASRPPWLSSPGSQALSVGGCSSTGYAISIYLTRTLPTS